jgi:RNA recognition motif-containing protein
LLHTDGVSRGFAFITMATPTAAEHALNLSGSFMDGRYRGEGGIVLDETERRSIIVNTQTNSEWEVVSEQDDEDASEYY